MRNLFNTDDNFYANPRIDKFGRCTVNGQTYSSDFNSTDRGSVVKAFLCQKIAMNFIPILELSGSFSGYVLL